MTDDEVTIGPLSVPREYVGSLTDTGGLETAPETILDDHGSSTATASPASTLEFTVRFSGPRASRAAYAFERALNSPTFAPVGVAGFTTAGIAGYYNAASTRRQADFAQPDDGDHDLEELDITLDRVGTKNSHYRALATKPRQLDHEFGNALDALLTLPDVARKPRWFDPEDQTVASAGPTGTRETEFGDVDIYDVEDGETAVGTDTPTLIYELDYADEAETGLRVYDTLGHAEKVDDDGVRQWEVVTWTRHDLDDAVVLDSGALRVEIDEHAGTITAEEWDGAGWVDVGLTNDSDWQVYDVDLVQVGMVTATAQLTVEDAVTGELFVLDVTLQRGDAAVLIDIPDGETGPIPQGIEDWLGAIASERLVDAQPVKGLVSRSEVRR